MKNQAAPWSTWSGREQVPAPAMTLPDGRTVTLIATVTRRRCPLAPARASRPGRCGSRMADAYSNSGFATAQRWRPSRSPLVNCWLVESHSGLYGAPAAREVCDSRSIQGRMKTMTTVTRPASNSATLAPLMERTITRLTEVAGLIPPSSARQSSAARRPSSRVAVSRSAWDLAAVADRDRPALKTLRQRTPMRNRRLRNLGKDSAVVAAHRAVRSRRLSSRPGASRYAPSST